ncbi:MAG: DUF6702 family protein [Bacteroidota bacterium]
MKHRILIICALFSIQLTSSSFSHPIKLTTSLIEYNEEKKRMDMECRVFIDDFQNTINRGFDASNLTKADIAEIEYYFDEFYRIVIGSKKLILNYESSNVYGSNTVLSLKFSVDDVTIKKGDALLIENKLFFTEYGPLQSNKMTLRIPPFVSEGYHETTFQDYSINYQF